MRSAKALEAFIKRQFWGWELAAPLGSTVNNKPVHSAHIMVHPAHNRLTVNYNDIVPMHRCLMIWEGGGMVHQNRSQILWVVNKKDEGQLPRAGTQGGMLWRTAVEEEGPSVLWKIRD